MEKSIDFVGQKGRSALETASDLAAEFKSFACLRFPGESESRVFVADESGPYVLRLRPFDLNREALEIRCSVFSTRSAGLELEDFSDADRNPAQIDTAHEAYVERGRAALDFLKNGSVQKVVLSRIRSLDAQTLSSALAFERLLTSRADDAVFWLRFREVGEWMGASPERLLVLEPGSAQTDALAGTRTTESGQEWTHKEIREQELVVEDIRIKLRKIGAENWSESQSERVQAKLVHRLTRFDWKTAASAVSFSGAWADLMHPTPAVAGLPLAEALAMIRRCEAHDRRLYAGYLQLIEPDRSRAYVVLRCAENTQGGWQAYSGGGWTSESNIESEWHETRLKTELILNSFDLDHG